MEATSPDSVQPPTPILRFGLFEVNRETGELRKAGIRLKLQEQPFQVLAALTENPGDLVTRDQLRARLWPGGEHLDYDHALTTAVKKLRGALNDSPTQPRYIETLPKRGYRFIAPVETVTAGPPPAAAQEEPATSPPGSRRLQTVLAVALAISAAGWLWTWSAAREPAEEAPVRRFSFAAEGPDGRPGFWPSVSPDGASIAYTSGGRRGLIQIRRMDDEEPQALEGTEGASRPIWSPDSQWLAFRSGGVLKRVSVYGGAPTTICELPGSNFIGASWAPAGDRIVFSSGVTPGLYIVDADGGTPEPFLAQHRGNGPLVFPKFVSEGGEARGIVFSIGGPSNQELAAAELDGDRLVRMGPGAWPVYDPSGYLLFQPSSGDEGLWAMPFSAERLEPEGAAVPFAVNGATASVSRDGTLVYADAFAFSGGQQLVWRDRTGAIVGEIGGPREIRVRSLALSPDERYVAVEAVSDEGDHIWVHDSQSGARVRLTFEDGLNASPAWAPDGSRVVFRQDREGNADIVGRAPDRSTDAEVLLATARAEVPSSFSPDGEALVYTVSDERTRYDIWMIEQSPETPRPLLVSPFNESSPAVSPDGRWLAFCSDEEGEFEVMVQPFPEGGPRVQVSQGGGCHPRWSANGRELFYVRGGALHAVEVLVDGEQFRAGSRARLFEHPSLISRSPLRTMYDVSGDGARFVTSEAVDQPERAERRIRVVENWTGLLNAR